MLRLAFVLNPYKPHTEQYARDWAAGALALGAPLPQIVTALDDAAVIHVLDQADLLLTLGGDGTLIRVARLAAPSATPALGVKFGHIGFLSSIKPQDLPAHLEDILEGRFWVEERYMLRGEYWRGGTPLGGGEALNDVVVSRGGTPHVIRLATYVDGALLDEFTCDGAIVATATGSTAYSLASGGPILAPSEASYLLTLISPYLSPIRSLVLPHSVNVTFRLHSPSPASLTFDGDDDRELRDGDEVRVSASPHIARFARLQSRTYFYEEIKGRLKRTD